MPGLESEEDAAKRLAAIKKISKMSNKEEPLKDTKVGAGLKIMTPNQLLTRLPILLAQEQARNTSQKLNNEKLIKNTL